ncbi:PREDICTED: uncharacterized protein LOC105570999 [Vollenhovia emeryi]|uniref:uncharacterized protein LOC105570999 n=1 Tax=Vollenhovia emeryi TaxID=411798 RepID=UPI0005F51E94|nr:PREDICTED: uncharacterized protein LOC105570999 [Vollenhovia emeryi]
MDINATYSWTDSQVTLMWIKTHSPWRTSGNHVGNCGVRCVLDKGGFVHINLWANYLCLGPHPHVHFHTGIDYAGTIAHCSPRPSSTRPSSTRPSSTTIGVDSSSTSLLMAGGNV